MSGHDEIINYISTSDHLADYVSSYSLLPSIANSISCDSLHQIAIHASECRRKTNEYFALQLQVTQLNVLRNTNNNSYGNNSILRIWF